MFHVKMGTHLAESAALTGHSSHEGDLTEELTKTLCQEECEILSAPIDKEIQVDATNAMDDVGFYHGLLVI